MAKTYQPKQRERHSKRQEFCKIRIILMLIQNQLDESQPILEIKLPNIASALTQLEPEFQNIFIVSIKPLSIKFQT